MQQLTLLYKAWAGVDPLKLEKIPGAGSNRQYYRIYSPDESQPSVIGVYDASAEESEAFVYLARHFSKRKLPVPQILKVAQSHQRYLQTDLGPTSLYDALSEGRKAGGRYNLQEQQLLKRTIQKLPEFQIRGAHGLDFRKCYPQPEFDRNSVLFDLNYFKYCFLKPLDIDFNELKLEASFQLLAKDLTVDFGQTFMYRDFQARNVMLSSDEQPYFIDFQGGRRGPIEYDVVSFLWQASARYPQSLREELIEAYLESLTRYMEVNTNKFRSNLKVFVLFRLLQVLGAYGFRGYFEKKQYFIDSIPPAIENLRSAIAGDCCPYPYLHDLLQRITELPQFQVKEEIKEREDGYKTAPDTGPYKPNPIDGKPTFSKYEGKGELSVRIYSFSYRKGIPEDEKGNGGGYVFDCRSTHNPGRYEPYKNLTGLDGPVIRFLENDGEILRFLEHVYYLADAHVERYIERGFTDLMFCFGCTGGQHRSVYSAEHLAQHIHEKYGLKVTICHREQHIQYTLQAQKK
ncbi:MAG: phosphotransferase [Bacteroidaceae bacterium]|nr:phosphotransferase [Bacteroidaceae bacterium]